MRLALALAAAFAAAPALAEDAPVQPATPGQETLEEAAVDGLRACLSIAEGRTPAEAAGIFGLTQDPADPTKFFHETDRGKITVQPPAADRRSCRTSIDALTLDNTAVIDAVQHFLITPPQSYAPLQSRIAEAIGDGFAGRVSIWASSDGHALSQVTLYEVLANEYYHGPKILIDHLLDKR